MVVVMGRAVSWRSHYRPGEADSAKRNVGRPVSRHPEMLGRWPSLEGRRPKRLGRLLRGPRFARAPQDDGEQASASVLALHPRIRVFLSSFEKALAQILSEKKGGGAPRGAPSRTAPAGAAAVSSETARLSALCEHPRLVIAGSPCDEAIQSLPRAGLLRFARNDDTAMTRERM